MTAPAGFRRNLFLTSPLMRGDDVLALQRGLAAQGARLGQDGLFGLATQAAVAAFQARRSLLQDGIAGRATWAAIFGAGTATQDDDDNARHCSDRLQAQGWTPEQACGIVANVKHESAFRPDIFGDGLRAYGLAQWHPDRQDAFLRQNGRSIVGSTRDDQLAFITFEMTRGTEQRAGAQLRAARTARAAGEIVSRFYERPASADAQAQVRGADAEGYFARFGLAAGSAPPARQAQAGPTIPPDALPARAASDILGSDAIQDLLRPHRMFRAGSQWALSDDGVGFVGAAPAAPQNADIELVQQIFEARQATLVSLLGRGQVPVELVLAAICAAAELKDAPQIKPGGDLTNPDRTPDRVSTGLMQTVLSMARIAVDKPDLSVGDLTRPDMALRAGIAAMWLQAAETGFDPPLVAAMFNVGSLRHDRRGPWRLLEFPLGAPNYVDRFIRYFNAAMRVSARLSLPPEIATFHRLIETAVAPVAPPATAAGPYVGEGPLAWISAPSVGGGECVALVRRATGAPPSSTWHRGKPVQGDASLAPGTAIATFDPDGRYANRPDGTCHAALYLDQDADGINVVDQWKGQPPHRRALSFNHPEKTIVNRGEAFHVVL